jgi:hypothetical protein
VQGILPIKAAHVIGTGGHADTTPNAEIVVDKNSSKLVLISCSYGTDCLAGGIFTVLARDRQVVTAEMRISAHRAIYDLTAFSEYAIPEHPHRHVILHLAGKGTSLATNTTLLADNYGELSHEAPPVFSISTKVS